MTVETRTRRWSPGRLQTVARRLMDASTLCALATVSPGGRAHINHMYFAWNEYFDVFWISDADSRHSRNLRANRTAAVTIYDSRQTWGRPDRGIQLLGTASAAAGGAAREAERTYAARFSDFDPEASELPFYRFRPRAVKLFDERALAAGTVVSAGVTAAGLVWVRTEVWT